MINAENKTAGRVMTAQATTMRWSVLAASLLVAAFIVAWPGRSLFAQSDQGLSAMQLLNEMSEALEKQNYRGTFVHMSGGHVETMQILHSHDGVGINERMISLNGEAREVFRNRKKVTCIWPGSKSIIVSKSKPRELLPKVDEALTGSDFYEFEMLPDDRVAGLEAHVVHVKPTDEFRYGYRFWVEKETRMLLRSALLDASGSTIEEIMFTDISFPDSIPLEELTANTDERDQFSWMESPDKPKVAPSGKERVVFAQLPGGYRKVSESYRPMPMNDHPVSHVLISDGMASISVYVEYTDNPGEESGLTSMGALNAYGRSLENAMVTVVGEVPSDTVRSIGDAVDLASAE
ncbi:MAG: MucB/RseB C-terminal domain-containing protein [Gammaproteobacteria bacterium]|nr:MucB/RseB C-terminal domain-containing protein [Gammaproteobacteria bacterium]